MANLKPKNPPLPPNARPLKQKEVTVEMTEWAKELLHDPKQYPMHAEAERCFGELRILARVEWHTYQGATGKRGIFRGVSLYQIAEPPLESA
jgi:hypothetical protein